MMRRETLRVGKIRNPSVAEGHSNFRFSSFQAGACVVCVSVCASSRTARYCLRACVRATESERLKRTVTCSFERTVSRKSLFFCESDLMICVRDLFLERRRVKKRANKIAKNLLFDLFLEEFFRRHSISVLTTVTKTHRSLLSFKRKHSTRKYILKVVGSFCRASFFLFKCPIRLFDDGPKM